VSTLPSLPSLRAFSRRSIPLLAAASLVVLLAGILVSLLRTPSAAAQSVGGAPPGCGEGCVYTGEKLLPRNCTSYPQDPSSHEAVLVELINNGPGTFRALVCLYDFTGMPVACNRETPIGSDNVGHRTVPPGQNEIWELVGPQGVNIWKVRWFICEGEGDVIIHGSSYCTVGCLENPLPPISDPICEPDPCEENWLPPVSFLQCSTVPGTQLVKVRLDNSCAVSQLVHYWWVVVQNGQRRELGPSGVTVPAHSTIFLCQSTHLFIPGDGYQSFLWFRRGNSNQCGTGSLTASVACNTCCADGGACSTIQGACLPGEICVPPGNP
jgi:hypothetical protein